MSLVGFKASNHPQQTDRRGARDDVDDRGTTWEVFNPLNERFRFTLDVAAAPHNAKCERYYTREDDGLLMPWGRARWQGEPCLMCNGTGKDFSYVLGEPDAVGIRPVISRAEAEDRPCRACFGHGREPTEDGPRERVWCNPPYSNLSAWASKAWNEFGWGRAELIVMLVPANRTEQGWWQQHVEPHRDRPGSLLRVEFLRGRMRFDRPGVEIGPKGDRPPFGVCLLIWGE